MEGGGALRSAVQQCPPDNLRWTSVAWGLVCGIVAIAGVVFLSLGRKKRGKRIIREQASKTSSVTVGETRTEGELDAIIVGAGVAGAALAYTLGMVCICHSRLRPLVDMGFSSSVSLCMTMSMLWEK